MRELFVLTLIGAIMAVCFLFLYSVGTFLAVVVSIVTSPLFWMVLIIFVIITKQRKQGTR